MRSLSARLRQLSEAMGCEVRPVHDGVYDWGLDQLKSDIERANEVLDRPSGLTGQTLHEAMHAYQEYIDKEYLDSDGTISSTGRTKWRQVKTLSEYIPDVDLGEIDFEKTDEIFGIFRRRPTSRRYGKRMTTKSCKNYIGVLGQLLNWLHRQSRFQWRKPEDFADIKRTPHEFDEDNRSGKAAWHRSSRPHHSR